MASYILMVYNGINWWLIIGGHLNGYLTDG